MPPATRKLRLCPPGEILNEEFIKPLGLSVYRLSKDIKVPANRIHAILKNERAITADTSLRLERYFGMSDGFFLRLQTDYDLRKAKRERGDQIKSEVSPHAA